MRFLSAALAAMATVVVATPTHAATYIVDNTISSLTFSNINFEGIPFGPQSGPGDATASYSGSFDATVSGGPTNPTITFGGGIIDADENPNAGLGYLPAEGGGVPAESSSPLAGGDFVFADGSPDPSGVGDGVFSVGEDNYGVVGSLFIGSSIYAAIRNFAITFTGGGTANDLITDAHALSVIDGWYAIDLGLPLAGVVGAEETLEIWAAQALGATTAGDIGYSLVGTTETITIPYEATFVAVGVFGATLSGEIVGTRTVPEPAGSLFLALAAGAWGVVRRLRT